MKGLFAHTNRWIAPDEVESQPGMNVVGVRHVHVGRVGLDRVRYRQGERTGVHVDSMNGRPGRDSAECQGDGSPATADVEKDPGVRRSRGQIEKNFGSLVEFSVAEHAAVGHRGEIAAECFPIDLTRCRAEAFKVVVVDVEVVSRVPRVHGG